MGAAAQLDARARRGAVGVMGRTVSVGRMKLRFAAFDVLPSTRLTRSMRPGPKLMLSRLSRVRSYGIS